MGASSFIYSTRLITLQSYETHIVKLLHNFRNMLHHSHIVYINLVFSLVPGISYFPCVEKSASYCT